MMMMMMMIIIIIIIIRMIIFVAFSHFVAPAAVNGCYETLL